MSYKEGWILCFIAGLIPFFVGIGGYLTAFILSCVINPNENFQVLWQTLSFSLNTLTAYNDDAGTFFAIASLCFWQLLIAFGALISSLSYFALRNGEKWSFYLISVALLWAAGNDTCVAIYLYNKGSMNIPTPIFVDIIGIIGLWKSRDIIYNDKKIK
eukprot:32163_1